MNEEETGHFSVRAEHYTDETNDASEPVLPEELVLEFTIASSVLQRRIENGGRKTGANKVDYSRMVSFK